MALFLTVREGNTPGDSYPIFATGDPEIIKIVVSGLTRKLDQTEAAPRVYKIQRSKKQENSVEQP
jgi:hypothetical protein